VKRSREGWAEVMRLKLSVQQTEKKYGKTHTYIDIHKKNMKRRFETEPNIKKKKMKNWSY
jgi:RNA:NAD 2'-phosphotransferase (TPT1/KptA family)